MTSWTPDEMRVLNKLSTPAKVQDFLSAMPYNAVDDNDTCMSPRRVLRHQKAQCMEGAMFAAAALRVHGFPPLILDLSAAQDDADHVVALFRIDGCWGAISKTNHAVLRYREPVYRTLRELAMSYFHEYFLQTNGKKTMRGFSRAIDLSRFDTRSWETNESPNWFIPEYLCDVPHTPILTKTQIARLRKADATERRAGDIVEWPPSSQS